MKWPWSRKDSPPPAKTHIRGVWATVHSTGGDFDTGTASEVFINGETMTFHLPRYSCPFSGTTRSVTLHMGALVVELPVTPPARFWGGCMLTVVQVVEWASLVAVHPIRRVY